jgi:hypothetical protein
MQTLTLILVAATSGFLGGVAAIRFVSAPQPPPPNPMIVTDRVELRGAGGECELTSRGLSCSTPDGAKAELTPFEISIEREEHRAVLGVMPSEQHLIHFPGGSFLLLDGKLYHPDRVNLLKLLQVMAATGEVDLNKLE